MMATADDLAEIALSLDGTIQQPHFDRVAFKVKRIYATLAADRLTANLLLSAGEQEFRCMVNPAAFSVVPNAFGARGWTTVTLAALDKAELHSALQVAWRGALPGAGRG